VRSTAARPPPEPSPATLGHGVHAVQRSTLQAAASASRRARTRSYRLNTLAVGAQHWLVGAARVASRARRVRERIAPPVRRADRAPTRGKVLLGWDEWRGAVFYEIEWRVRHVAGGPWGAWTGSDGARRLTVAHCQKALPAGADGALPSAVMFRVRPLARTGEPLARFSDGSQPFDVPR